MAEKETKDVEAVEAVKEEKKELDFSDLEAKLGELNAQAFMDAERACRMKADATPDITYSAGFRARLAARALGVDFKEIQNLPIPVFAEITARVLNFLLSSSAAKLMNGEG
jgi:hypothetical protein